VSALQTTVQHTQPNLDTISTILEEVSGNQRELTAAERDNIYPQAKRTNSMSRKKRVNHNTHELRIAATVKMTVRINQAQQYMPSALLKSELSWPLASV
jgi:hypothetical protein